MMDTSRIQIGDEVLLDVDVNSRWEICGVTYDYGGKPHSPRVTIELCKKEEQPRLGWL